MKTTYSPSLMSGEDSLPGKRQETSAGILRVRMSHSISRRVTEEPCHEPRSGPEPASSSSTRAPLNELDICAPERPPEERLAAEGSLELQGPVGTLHENNGEETEEPSPQHENGADEYGEGSGQDGQRGLTGEGAKAAEARARKAERRGGIFAGGGSGWRAA